MKKTTLLILSFLLAGLNVLYAQGPPVPQEAANSLAIVLLIIMLSLLLVIGILSYVLLGAAQLNLERFKNEKRSTGGTQAVLLVLFSLVSVSLFAQTGNVAAVAMPAANNFGGLSPSSYYTMVSIIGLELLLIMVMAYFVKILIAKDAPVKIVAGVMYKVPVWKTWWEKLNAFKADGEVGDTGHNYDGIRELDNKLPPWWLYGFFLTIVFAVVYLYRAQISHTAPSPVQEYEIAMANAEIEKEAYLKTAASKVDENTVTYLAGAEDIGSGKKIFGLSCAPCHGADAQGSVGPNLTDDYWLHQGSLKDIFKTIKYGVPEKGMKSWKDDFSPIQIAQLTSYIHSVHQSKPANAKEPQGELYKVVEASATDNAEVTKNIAANK